MVIPYNLKDFYRGLRNPNRAKYHFNKKLRSANRYLNSRFLGYRFENGFNVLAEDWDNLIILDGCRYDMFEKHNTFQGDLNKINSKGGHSQEFLQKTFNGEQLHDTVYITSNPWSEKLSEETFFLTKRTYTESKQGGKARLPEDVVRLAIDTFKKYPNKRYIVHFMQPNNPYIGPNAEKLRDQLLREQNVLCTELTENSRSRLTSLPEEIPNLRRALIKGYISRDQMLDIYTENLEIVIGHAKRMINEMGGRSAITADHGDMFGERLPPLYLREYSHHREIYSNELRIVPWLVQDSKERRNVQPSTPKISESMEKSAVRDQLKSMGYLSG